MRNPAAMKHFGWQWLVASSLLFGLIANAATRPRYGGTAHIAMRAALTSLDPADQSIPDSEGRRSVSSLIFDTLVALDGAARVKPSLADSWQCTDGVRRCTFHLRGRVKFQDGILLTPE